MSAMGLTAGLSVLLAVLASITLVPAVLSIAGKRMVPKSNKKKINKALKQMSGDALSQKPYHAKCMQHSHFARH